MKLDLNERQILGHFDRLVKEGILVYNNYTTITTADKGFRVCLAPPQSQVEP